MFLLSQSAFNRHRNVIRALVIVSAFAFSFAPTLANSKDQHSVEAIVAALQSPIPPDMLKQAQDFDDQIMSGGQTMGRSVYLVTDERSTSTYAIVRRLLRSMGEDPSHWVVRVLDTDEPMVQAFVTGGKYIYVFTGLIDEAKSEDELAFVLGHELGHSLLQQQARTKKDSSSMLANLATLAALLSKKNSGTYMNMAKALTSSYNRLNEEEADALSGAITRRAGFDPLRGADFFSRAKREQDQIKNQYAQKLVQDRQQVQKAQANCVQWTQHYNSSRQFQTQEAYQLLTALCQEAEALRLQYNQFSQQYSAVLQQQQTDSFFSTHPANQNRIAAIAALTDYLSGRRDLQSIAKHKQTYRVMVALNQMGSVLLDDPIPQVSTASAESRPPRQRQASGRGLADELQDLKYALDQGLLTRAELGPSIGSTLSGTGAAVLNRITRDGSVRFAESDDRLAPFIKDTRTFLRERLGCGERIIVEGTQGFGLSVLHAKDYPYVTSRDTTASGFLSEAGLSPLDVDEVVMVLRAFPIRVSGNSGPLPKETDWEAIRQESGYQTEITERTTVTDNVRRVAQFDSDVVRAAIEVNAPSKIVLNHIDYIDASCRSTNCSSDEATRFVSWVEGQIDRPVDYLGFGPASMVRNQQSRATAISA